VTRKTPPGSTGMFTGLTRSLAIIVAMLTVLPWGIMQIVQ
jgi:hypothetical protein